MNYTNLSSTIVRIRAASLVGSGSVPCRIAPVSR